MFSVIFCNDVLATVTWFYFYITSTKLIPSWCYIRNEHTKISFQWIFLYQYNNGGYCAKNTNLKKYRQDFNKNIFFMIDIELADMTTNKEMFYLGNTKQLWSCHSGPSISLTVQICVTSMCHFSIMFKGINLTHTYTILMINKK